MVQLILEVQQYICFHSRKCICKYCLQIVNHFALALTVEKVNFSINQCIIQDIILFDMNCPPLKHYGCLHIALSENNIAKKEARKIMH